MTDEKTILPGSVEDLAESTDKRERARTILMGRHRLASIKLEGELRERIKELEKELAEARAERDAEVAALREGLLNAADTLRDAAAAYHFFGKHVAAEAMEIAEKHSRVLLEGK